MLRVCAQLLRVSPPRQFLCFARPVTSTAQSRHRLTRSPNNLTPSLLAAGLVLANMDYRSSMPDDEQAAGWGSPPATPQRNVVSYGSLSSSQSPTPYQYGDREPGNGFAQEDSGIDAFRRPNTASSTASTAGYDPSEQSEPSEPAGLSSEPEAPPNAPQQQLPPQGEPTNSGPSNAPGVQQAQQPRRPPGPQYKLQAKITGLERTGKKDPVLRFDVHVRVPTATQLFRS